MLKTIPKTVFYGTNPRKPHCSPEFWNVEPFDAELEVWTLGQEAGFIWALVPANPESNRYRTVPEKEGSQYLRAVWQNEERAIVLAGNLLGGEIEIEISHFFIQITGRHAPIDLAEYVEQVAQVCEYLRGLQFYDGDARYKMDGGLIETFVGMLGLKLAKKLPASEGWMPPSPSMRVVRT